MMVNDPDQRGIAMLGSRVAAPPAPAHGLIPRLPGSAAPAPAAPAPGLIPAVLAR